MEKELFGTFKKFILELKNELKVYKKLDDYKLKKIISIISEFGKDSQLYSFLMSSLANMNFDKVNYIPNGIVVLDEENNKSLQITLLPNYKDVKSISIELKDDEVVNRKRFDFIDNDIIVYELKEKGNVRFKTKRKYINNELVYEDVSRMKGDFDNYYWICNTSIIDEDYNVKMKEFVQIRKEGMIESQRFKFYQGYLYDTANFYTRSASNISNVFEYIEDDKEEINAEMYYDEISSLEQETSNIIKFVPRKKRL